MLWDHHRNSHDPDETGLFPVLDERSHEMRFSPPPMPKNTTRIVDSWQFRFGVAMLAIIVAGTVYGLLSGMIHR